MNNSVAVILINYKGKSDTEDCVQSLKSTNYSDLKILIVDNASPEGNVEYNDIISHDICEIIQLEENIGFAGGNNIGIKRAQELEVDYFFLLNNDTVVEKECIHKLVEKSFELNNQQVLTTKIVYYDEPNILWYGGCRYVEEMGEYKISGIGKNDSAEFNFEHEVDYITGCVMFIPKNIIEKVGYLSEDYFLYYEDADYCKKIGNAGYCMRYIPSICIYHKESRSTKKGSDLYQYYILRNYLLYIETFNKKKIMRYGVRKFIQSYKEVFRKRMKFYVWKEAWSDYFHKRTGKKSNLY